MYVPLACIVLPYCNSRIPELLRLRDARFYDRPDQAFVPGSALPGLPEVGGSLDTSLRFRLVAEELPIASLVGNVLRNLTCTPRCKAVFTVCHFKYGSQNASVKTYATEAL